MTTGCETIDKVRAELEVIAGPANVISDEEKIIDYSHDEFSLKNIACLPALVVKPGSEPEIAEILKTLNSHRIPVTPRGGATGLCGGCVPCRTGVVLSLERLDRILEIDHENQLAVVEAGVRLGDFARAVEAAGLYFPPHPGDESAMIGGLVATNAGGSRAVKYGTIRNYVRGLGVVLPEGKIINLGGKFIKTSTGYNLMQLFIGSEGTLGVITRVILQLNVKPQFSRSFVVPFASLDRALETVSVMLKDGIVPLAVEFLELEPITITEKHLNLRWPTKLGCVHLLIIIDACSEDELDRMSERIGDVCLKQEALNIYIADTPAKQSEILTIRSKIYDAIKAGTVEILDISLPRAEVAGHVRRVREIAEVFAIWLPTFGHAADGNIHTHIMKASYRDGELEILPETEWQDKVHPVRTALFEDARRRGGVISGEHGIGLVKKPYLQYSLDNQSIKLMQQIKQVFDPNNIMNPGKIFD